MQATQFEEYKRRLLEMRSRLRNELSRRDQAIREKGKPAGEIVDLPTHQADRDTEGLREEIIVGQSQADMLDAVETSLQNIELGEYGRCEECGREIPEARLEAIPYALYCVDCERRREQELPPPEIPP